MGSYPLSFLGCLAIIVALVTQEASSAFRRRIRDAPDQVKVSETIDETSDLQPREAVVQPSSLPEFRSVILSTANAKRERHHSPPLKLNETLNDYAQKLADNLSGTHRFIEQSMENTVPNTFIAYPNQDVRAEDVVQLWYNQESKYNYSLNQFDYSSASFSLLVWKATTHIGCGLSKDTHGSHYVVCVFSPQGNVPGQFAENVLRP